MSSALGLAVLVTGIGSLGTPSATAARSGAEAVQAVPADGTIVFDGRGFGHGRGMSQWGAYGAADAGLSWKQILEFYYPGTTQATQSNTEMRVWISRDNDGITEVPPQPGLTATTGRTAVRLPVGAGYTAWRAVATGAGAALQYRDARGVWRAFRTPVAPTVAFSAGDTVRVTMPGGSAEDYAGRVFAIRQGSSVQTIVTTTTERYLRGVVPNEMPSSWHPQAVAAQSVAARTYAASYRARQRAKGSPWDICDTVTCQVYRGTAVVRGSGRTVLDDARADAAIAMTAGTVLKTPGDNFVHAEFSASSGGYTVDGGAFSQVAKPDPYDGRMANPVHTWTRTVSASTLEKQFGLGTLRTVQVLGRDGNGPMNGRVSSMRLVGSARTVDVSGTRMRQVLGLRSDWFTPRLSGVTTRPDGASVVPRPPTAGSGSSVRPAPSLGANVVGDRFTDRLTIEGGRLHVARGTGSGRFATATPVKGAPAGLVRFVGAGDVDGDRLVDIAVVDSRNRLLVLRGNGRGAVIRTIVHGGGWHAFTAFSVRDVTGDRRADIVATRPDGTRWLYVAGPSGKVAGTGRYTGR